MNKMMVLQEMDRFFKEEMEELNLKKAYHSVPEALQDPNLPEDNTEKLGYKFALRSAAVDVIDLAVNQYFKEDEWFHCEEDDLFGFWGEGEVIWDESEKMYRVDIDYDGICPITISINSSDFHGQEARTQWFDQVAFKIMNSMEEKGIRQGK